MNKQSNPMKSLNIYISRSAKQSFDLKCNCVNKLYIYMYMSADIGWKRREQQIGLTDGLKLE